MHSKGMRILGTSTLIVFGVLLLVFLGSYGWSSESTWPTNGDPNNRGRALDAIRSRIPPKTTSEQLQSILGEPNVIATKDRATFYWDIAKTKLNGRVSDRDKLWIYFVNLEPTSWYEDIPPQRFVVVLDDQDSVKYVSSNRDIIAMYGTGP